MADVSAHEGAGLKGGGARMDQRERLVFSEIRREHDALGLFIWHLSVYLKDGCKQ